MQSAYNDPKLLPFLTLSSVAYGCAHVAAVMLCAAVAFGGPNLARPKILALPNYCKTSTFWVDRCPWMAMTLEQSLEKMCDAIDPDEKLQGCDKIQWYFDPKDAAPTASSVLKSLRVGSSMWPLHTDYRRKGQAAAAASSAVKKRKRDDATAKKAAAAAKPKQPRKRKVPATKRTSSDSLAA